MEKIKKLCLYFLLICVKIVSAQDNCYGAGSIAFSVILSVIITLLLIGAVFYWIKRKPKTEHLILATDPERGKAEYAFDNPGFKDAGFTPLSKTIEKVTTTKTESEKKNKWNNFPGLSVLTANKNEKRKTLDDSNILENGEIKIVTLRSHDFTGLGFNICGNMKDGIYIKDILNRGPASECGKLNTGDRINSITINFEHIVYEDALTILSYASPYEVILEAKSGKFNIGSTIKGNHQPIHPIYKSSSSTDLQNIEKSARKKLYNNDTSIGSNHSTLHKSLSNMTTLERKNSKSPLAKNLNSEKLKNQLEEKITSTETELRIKNEPIRVDIEKQKSENKHQKFGVKVFPTTINEQQKIKVSELTQNDNNINIEIHGLDEVDTTKPHVEKRKKKIEENLEQNFKRNGSLNGSGLKRDSNGIPQEIPSHMLNAAVAARRNRKSLDELNDDDTKMINKKTKGKAPPPPPEDKKMMTQSINNLDEIKVADEVIPKTTSITTDNQIEKENSPKKNYNSDDSDDEIDNQSSVNTIELNSSDITIHHEENEEKQNRKTASTGDLSKIHKTRKSSTGTLERAQSLDITDSGMPTTLTKKRKGGKIEDIFDMKSDEDLFGKAMINKEPRLSLILDGLNTFQRNRLKKSTEWGNLEDVILKSNQDERDTTSPVFNKIELNEKINLNFGEKSKEFDAVVNKIKEIRRESQEMVEINLKDSESKNQIWPTETDKPVEIQIMPPPVKVRSKAPSSIETEISPKQLKLTNVQNEIWPKELNQNTEVEIKIPNDENEIEKKKITEKEIIQIKKENQSAIKIPDDKISEITEDMIEAETPPDAILIVNDKQEMHTDLDDLPEILQMNSVEAKQPNSIHKRQQIPNSEIQILPPPELNVPNLEEEIFEEIKRNHKTPTLKVENSTVIVPTEASASNEEIQSKMNGNIYTKEKSNKISEISANLYNTDESKTSINPRMLNDNTNFILNERYCNEIYQNSQEEDTNISDDIKVSRHSMGSLERPKSDDVKSIESLKYLSNVTINSVQTENGSSSLHSLEFSVNEPSEEANQSNLSENSELYTTALNKTLIPERDLSKITITTPDLIKNVSITEAITTLNSDLNSTSFGLENSNETLEHNSINVNNSLNGTEKMNGDNKSNSENSSNKNHSSLTYITEIQVTPTNGTSNISEIEIVPSMKNNGTEENSRNLDNEFENYIKNFEVKTFDTKKELKIKDEEIKKIDDVIISGKIDPEKELHKIQEIAQEQLKKLPEMRFSTSSYESPSRIPEKRYSQIELLRSNFEKSPPKSLKTESVTKSRIPISTIMKSPQSSPERRDSKNLDMENDKELLELMSSSVHSTPMTNSLKYQKSPNKNVTITSIRNNSKIPSGLPILGGYRPPVPPKKTEQENDSIVQITSNNSNINSFKQWVFDPVESVTNISLSGQKQEQK